MNTLFPVVIFWYIKLLNMMNDKINDVLVGGDSHLKIACLTSGQKRDGGGDIWFDRQLKMDTHITKICKTAFFPLI